MPTASTFRIIMSKPSDESPASGRPRRERSTRYPGVSLAESLKLVESIDRLGLDGLPAPEIASALGFRNIKTNTFSAPLSAARQFGLLNLTGNGYTLSPLAREILHPVDLAEVPRLHRQALLKPPLYGELAERLTGKRVPDATILGNVLYHNHNIIASAKQSAAEAFLESARFAGALGDDLVFEPEGHKTPSVAAAVTSEKRSASASSPSLTARAVPPARPAAVRLDLQLWDADEGKTIRLRAPQSITAASFERFLQAFRLLVRIEDQPRSDETT
jgi:hypothetical protein